jgi:5-formyltetrahydrofolate cyclo-ligase
MDAKESLRKELLRRRDTLPPDVRIKKSRLILETFFSLPEVAESAVILFYASFRSEVETMEMIEGALKEGLKVVLPRVDERRRLLSLHQIHELKELTSGYMGIPEPRPEINLVNPDGIDLIVVPGVAFDPKKSRLGYGGGYYDRLLKHKGKNVPAIGLAFEEQLVDKIRTEDFDVAMDLVVTDLRVIR